MSESTVSPEMCLPQGALFQGVPKPAEDKRKTETVDYDSLRFYNPPSNVINTLLYPANLISKMWQAFEPSWGIIRDACQIETQPGKWVFSEAQSTTPTIVYPISDKVPVSLSFMGKDVSPDILVFCRQEGIFSDLRLAFELATGTFSFVDSYDVELTSDMESDDRWLTLSLVVYGDVSEALESYDAFVEDWVTQVDPSKVDKIRLSYHFK